MSTELSLIIICRSLAFYERRKVFSWPVFPKLRGCLGTFSLEMSILEMACKTDSLFFPVRSRSMGCGWRRWSGWAHSDVDVILNFFDFTKHTINSLASPCCHFFIRPYVKRLIRKIVFSEMIRLAAESA